MMERRVQCKVFTGSRQEVERDVAEFLLELPDIASYTTSLAVSGAAFYAMVTVRYPRVNFV